MADQQLLSVFLSASIPSADRDPKYYATGKVVNIREAVRALAFEVLPKGRLVFGGHPAISPFVRSVAESLGASDRVRIYQSRFFENLIPEDSRHFPDIVWTVEVDGDREKSLERMRREMLSEPRLVSGVFIGGMEGVEEEYRLFKKLHPELPAYPIPTTGGAASMLFDESQFDQRTAERLRSDWAYDLLFADLIWSR